MRNFALIFIISLLFFAVSVFLNRKCRLISFLNYSVAFAVTIALTGYSYYLGLLFSISYKFLLASFAMIPALYLFITLRDKNSRSFQVLRRTKISNVLILIVAISILTIRLNGHLHRWGDWDAWAIWNLHAKFLFYPAYWTNMFTNKLAATHPDYPLMLPSLIAFLWKSLGFITPIVPIIIANLICIAIPTTIFLALNRFDSLFSAIFSLAILTLDTKFINIAGSQYADTLVAFFILITFILYKEFEKENGSNLVFLLGFIAGSTTWIKNEGLLFFLIFSCTFICFHYKRFGIVFRYLAGGLVPVLILIHFKVTLAPANDLIHSGRGADLISMITNPDRYMLIVKHVFITSINYYWILLVLFAGVLIQRAPFLRSLPFVVVSLMLSGYFAIYLTTPNDLNWHLGASLDRLFHHIYPASIYLLLLRLSSKQEKINTLII